MPRLRSAGLSIAAGLILLVQTAGMAQQRVSGRALTIEDYYRIQTVGSPSISPNGKWVAFTVSTRIEEDNGTRSEAFLVPADGSAKPWRVVHFGKDVTGPRWTSENWLQYSAERGQWKIDPDKPAAPVKTEALPSGAVLSADGRWIAQAKDKARAPGLGVRGSGFGVRDSGFGIRDSESRA